MLDRIVPCNAYLKQIRIATSEWCPFCDETDTVSHFLYSCAKVRPFWQSVCRWFQEADNLFLEQLSAEEFMFGVNKGVHRACVINGVTLMFK